MPDRKNLSNVLGVIALVLMVFLGFGPWPCSRHEQLPPRPPVATADSEDGRFRLVLTRATQVQASKAVLVLIMGHVETEENVLAYARHEDHAVWNQPRPSFSFYHALDAPSERIEELEVPVGFAWIEEATEHKVEVPGFGEHALRVGPLEVHATLGPRRVTLDFTSTVPFEAPLDWALAGAPIEDPSGAEFRWQAGGHHPQHASATFGSWSPGGDEGMDYAFPLTLRFRIPVKYETEEVVFTLRDVPLDPIFD